MITRIAMWSGPRNISTAMMRAWENRADTQVIDEPFYACYLSKTGIIHPMQNEIMQSQSSDWQTVIDKQLKAPLNNGCNIQFQKHMTQHMVVDVDSNWFSSVKHAFLIRNPDFVVKSYAKKREVICAEDLGYEAQYRLFRQAQSHSVSMPPVIDSLDVIKNPEQTLVKLCDALGVEFDSRMLSWPAGPRDSDGVWAPHWYHNVENSTGFSKQITTAVELTSSEKKVANECRPFYEALAEHKL